VRRLRVTPKFISPADPAARVDRELMAGQAFFAYSTNYLIDVDTTRSSSMSKRPLRSGRPRFWLRKRMIRTPSMERFGLHPAKLMGDSAYGSADMLGLAGR